MYRKPKGQLFNKCLLSTYYVLAPSHTRPVGKLSESTFGTHSWDLSVFAYCLGCGLHKDTTWSLLCAQHTEQCLLAYSRYLITVCWRFNVCPFFRGVNRDPGSCGNLPHSPIHPQNCGSHTGALQLACHTGTPSPRPLSQPPEKEDRPVHPPGLMATAWGHLGSDWCQCQRWADLQRLLVPIPQAPRKGMRGEGPEIPDLS